MAHVTVDRHGAVTVITIDRPAKHNALSSAVAADLRAAVEEFGRDDGQRVVVITGAGDRAFCAGGDLAEMAHRLATGSRSPIAALPDIAGVAACEKPVIAAINGLAVAGGLELALCCDVRIAATTAWFAALEVTRGLVPGVAATRLPALVPLGDAMDLLLSARRMTAREALRIGLVQQVVPPEQLMATAVAKAEVIAAHPPGAVRAIKATLRYWRDAGLAERHRYYQAVCAASLDRAEILESTRAFVDRRSAAPGGWNGKGPT